MIRKVLLTILALEQVGDWQKLEEASCQQGQ